MAVRLDVPKYYSAFGPVIDRRSVLPQDLTDLLVENKGLFSSCDILLGVVKSEGFLFLNENEITNGISPQRKSQLLRTYIRNVYSYHRQRLYDVIWHHYSEYEQTENPSVLRDEMMELLGDAQYVAPVIDMSNAHAQAQQGATYFYTFSYPARLNTYPRWSGGVHGDDLIYILGAPLTNGIDPFVSTYTESEQMLSEAVMTYWSNFIRNG